MFDPVTLLGLGVVMHIESAIEYLKANWRLSKQWSPFAATVLAFGVQAAIVFLFHKPLTDTLIGTIFTGAGACFWHELSSK